MEKQTRKTTKEAGIAGVQLDADANDLVQAWCDKTGRIKRDVLSKLSRWWIAQPLFFRQITLSEMDSDLQLAYAEQLELLAKKIRQQLKPPVASEGEIDEDETKPGPRRPKGKG